LVAPQLLVTLGLQEEMVGLENNRSRQQEAAVQGQDQIFLAAMACLVMQLVVVAPEP
jgi:hypothetical protein